MLALGIAARESRANLQGRLDLFYASLGVLQTLNTAAFVALAYYSPATNAPPPSQSEPLREPAEAP